MPTVNNTPNSVTNECMHWSVREKMDQMSKTDPASISPALTGFEYDENNKLWVWKGAGDQKQRPLPEFPLPGGDTLQDWLCGDWLKSQH